MLKKSVVTWQSVGSYSLDLSLLLLWGRVWVECESLDSGILAFLDDFLLGIARCYRAVGVLSSFNDALRLELPGRSFGRHGERQAVSRGPAFVAGQLMRHRSSELRMLCLGYWKE